MISFASPQYLYLLLIVIPMGAIAYWSYLQRRKAERRFSEVPLLKNLKPESSTKRRIWKSLAFILAYASLVVSLAGPQVPKPGDGSDTNKGYEVMICLDISNSMYCKDISPNRLDFSKLILSRLFEDLSGNKVGLIVFAGNSYIHIPITTDISSAKELLDGVDPQMISNQGTAIDKSINLAAGSFSNNNMIGKAIIVITDGEEHEGNPEEAAKKALKAGVHTYVIGIGSPSGGTIEMPNGEILKDESGQPVITKFNEELCRSIAQAGGGEFYTGNSASALVKTIKNKLDKLPKANIRTAAGAAYYNLYGYPLCLALLLLLIEMFIQLKKSSFFTRFKLFDR
ncbi:MAG: VWA domain-containing protein [Porphyromonadaceae bacterium]|nr:VWA domain-containing protein [Porphyromonadaceae bacterium]